MTKAFTIVELLVVIVVLGILLGIGVPRINGMMNNSKMVRVKGELTTLQTAIESYYTFISVFPPSGSTICASYLTKTSPNVVGSVLYDPFGATATSEYQYLLSSNGRYYAVWSTGLPGSLQPTSVTNSGDIGY